MAEWKSKASLNDRKWKYIPAAATDVAKTIARVKREMQELAKAEEESQAKAKHVVTPIKKAAAK